MYLFLTILEVGSQWTRCWQIQSVEDPFLVHRQFSSCCVLTWWKGQEFSRASITRALIWLTWALPSRPNYLMRPHLQYHHNWGLGFNIWIWLGKGGHKYSTYGRNILKANFNFHLLCSLLLVTHSQKTLIFQTDFCCK